MPNYNQNAIEGHVYSWHLQRKPPKFAHDGLLKITNTEVWSLEDVKSFYNEIDRGEYTLEGDDAIKGFIYCLYRQKLSCKAAHAKISKVLDGIKIEVVMEIYQKIEMGYNMETISFEGILKLMNEKIINELDLQSRFSLRNTSKTLRKLIDKGEFTVKKLEIEICKEVLRIKDHQGCVCLFRKKGNKCEIRSNGEYKNVKGEYWKRAQTCFQLLLSANMRIDKLVLKAAGFFKPELSFLDVLKSLPKKLKVKKLNYDAPNYHTIYHLGDLINCFDPNELKDFHSDCYLPGYFACQLFKSQHWKNLKTFTCYEQVFYPNLRDTFGHINYVRFTLLRYPTIDELVKLKDTLLQNRNFEQIRLRDTPEKEQVDELKKHFDRISDFKTPFDVVPATNRSILSAFISSNDIAFKGPCCECSFTGDTAKLRGTASGSREDLHREKYYDPMWYHFYY